MRLHHARGGAFVLLSGLVLPRMMQAANSVFLSVIGVVFKFFGQSRLGCGGSAYRPNLSLKGTCRLLAVLKVYFLSSFVASVNVRERHAP